jgi:hypothetical protein
MDFYVFSVCRISTMSKKRALQNSRKIAPKGVPMNNGGARNTTTTTTTSAPTSDITSPGAMATDPVEVKREGQLIHLLLKDRIMSSIRERGLDPEMVGRDEPRANYEVT